jgi:hypothetical protein
MDSLLDGKLTIRRYINAPKSRKNVPGSEYYCCTVSRFFRAATVDFDLEAGFAQLVDQNIFQQCQVLVFLLNCAFSVQVVLRLVERLDPFSPRPDR